MPFKYDPTKVCQQLRCKEMLIHTDHTSDHTSTATDDATDEGLFDPYDAVAYWCECTQTGRGPDGERVHMDCCSLGTSRQCFVNIDSIV